MTHYYFIAASQRFLCEQEPLDEVFQERARNYEDRGKAIDFWCLQQPAFLEAPELAEVKAQCPQPAAAILSTDSQFITWMKLRLEYVLQGEFEAPSTTIPDPLASQAQVYLSQHHPC